MFLTPDPQGYPRRLTAAEGRRQAELPQTMKEALKMQHLHVGLGFPVGQQPLSAPLNNPISSLTLTWMDSRCWSFCSYLVNRHLFPYPQAKSSTSNKQFFEGAGMMGQWLGALVTLAQHPCLIPSTHVLTHNHP